MTILRDFGKSESDLGLWFPFGEEVPAPFEVRVRRIPHDVAMRISKRYGREVMTVVDGVRRPSVERTFEETTKWLLDQAAWALVDVRGLQIEVADEAAASLWSGLLKQDVIVSQVLDLTGPALTNEVKQRLLTQIRPFATMTNAETMKKERQELSVFIILKSALLASDANRAEEEARGN